MKLIIEKEDKEVDIELEKPLSVKEFLKSKGISVESVILVKNKTICLEDEMLDNSDTLELLSVISGG